jgi:hypothetical protein
MARTSYIQWIRFVLDQHALLDLYSASSLKQQSTARHVAPLGQIILTLCQPVFALSLLGIACLPEKQQIPILLSFV